jgi:hypothetical protein
MTIFVGHSSLLSSLTFRTVPSERTLPAETVPSPLLDRLQFFFFWSRVVGSVVAFAIRQYLWRSQKIWIEFGQPLPSLLSSRLSPLPSLPYLHLCRRWDHRCAADIAASGPCPDQELPVSLGEYVCSSVAREDQLEVLALEGSRGAGRTQRRR